MTDGTALRDDPLISGIVDRMLITEDVNKILDTIPDPVHRSFLIGHMRASEKFAYEAGLMAGRKSST